MILFYNSKDFKEYNYTKEEDFENDVVMNSKLFFGQNTIYIDAKKKIESKSLGGAIPDGFLFDLSDKNNPDFYIVEVELSIHPFYEHIFRQITKFFAFFKNTTSHSELIDKLYKIITSDELLEKEFNNLTGKKEIYKFIKDTLDNSQNILLIIDGEKKELPETFTTYTEWERMVKNIILKKYVNNSECIFSMEPEFQNIEYVIGATIEEEEETITYTEEERLEKSSHLIKEIYNTLKKSILSYNPNAIFNPRGYYISIKTKRNVAFFRFRKNKIKLIVMMHEDIVKTKITSHKIISLSEGVQDFYNGPCCAIEIDSRDNLEEVIELLKELVMMGKEV